MSDIKKAAELTIETILMVFLVVFVAAGSLVVFLAGLAIRLAPLALVVVIIWWILQ